MIASSSGAVQEQCYYFPYGGQQSCTGSDPNHYKFTGKERDTESNLDEFGARYYSSSVGRFMTPDWAARPTGVPYAVFGDPQSLNLYTYVRNDPVTNADADGHCGEQGENPCERKVAESLWGRIVGALPSSKTKTAETNLVNETDKDESIGMVGNTKIAGASATASIKSDPAKGTAQVSASVEAHGVQTELNFSSNPDGSKGAVNGQVTNSYLTGQASGTAGSNGFGVKAEAQVVTFGGSLNIGPITLTGSVCAICVGAKASFTTSGASAGAEGGLVGADFSVRWQTTTLFSKSADQN